jgi:LuxR family transcriptional regulator, maltose regulon positive regulatory protein
MATRRPQLAKLTRPRLHKAVARERLYELLDEKREHPMVWVVGPPGAGKTTLVASYLEAAGLAAIWYQIDSGDSDPATFFYYLRQAIAVAAPKKAKPLPLLTPEYLPDLAGFSRRYFRDAFARLPEEAVLVLDNYQEAAAESALHEAFAAGLEETPTGANIVVVSRAEPPPAFAKAVVNKLIARLSWEELQLTRQETAAVAAARGLTDEAAARALHAQSDGWIAGVALMLERLQQGESLETLHRPETLDTVFDYFAGLLFDRTDEDTRQVLLKTAFLPRVTPALAAAVTGRADAIRPIEDLHRRHLFIDRRIGSETSYQYHALFKAFLKARAKQALACDQLLEIASRAADALSELGEIEEAFALFAEAQDWSRAEQILLDGAAQLIAHGRLQTLQEWVKTLPKARVNANPWVRYWFGRSQIYVDPVAARSVLESVYRDFSIAADDPGQTLSAAAVLEALYFDFREFRSMDAWIERLSDLLEKGVQLPSREDELRAYSNLIMGATYRAPEHPALQRWLEQVRRMLLEPFDPNLKVMVANMLHAFGNMVVDEETEQFAIHIARPLLESAQLTPWNAAFYLACEGYTHYVHGRYPEAFAYFDRADVIAVDHGLNDVLLTIGAWRTLCARRAGMLDHAEATIRRIEAIPIQRKSVAAPLAFLKACIAFDRGDLDRAVSGAFTAVQESFEGGQFNGLMLVRLVCGNILAGSGEFEAAKDLLRAVRDDVSGPITAHYLGATALNEAWLAHRQGEQAERDALLREALQRARDKRARERFRWYPNALSELLPIALAQGLESDVAASLAREFRIVPSPLHVESWPWPIKVYTLGRFEILLDDKPPRFSRKAPKKALTLLKALVALGGRDVAEEQIADVLWPDEEGDTASRALTTMLHRLRGLLGIREAISQRGGRLSIDTAICWVDAFAFEHVLTQSDPCTERAVHFYRGAFLPQEEDASWAVSTRERLRARFVDAVGTHADTLERQGRVEEALQCYRKGLEADDLVERFYQGLMRCYDRLERRTEVASAYQRLRQLLSIRLGARPSPATERLYQQIRPN